MRQDEVALQLDQIGIVDLDRGELPEPGIDPIDGRIARGDLGNTARALLDAGIEGAIERRGGIVPVDL